MLDLPQIEVSDACSTAPFGTIWRGLQLSLVSQGALAIMRRKVWWSSAQRQRMIFLRKAGGLGMADMPILR